MLKDALEGLKQQVDIKGDVITKAQAIIQKLTTKSEQDESIMEKLSGEVGDLRQEVSSKQRAISDLHSQLEEIRNKQSVAATQMNDYMGKELDEMRQSLREYQLELNSEKKKYHDQINGLHEQLGQKQLEIDRLQQDLQINLDETAGKLRTKDEQISEAIDNLRREKDTAKDAEEELLKRISLIEESAKNQVAYLQNRIKEVVEETTQNTQKTGLVITQPARSGEKVTVTPSERVVG